MKNEKMELNLILAQLFARREFLFYDKSKNLAKNSARRISNLQHGCTRARNTQDMINVLANSIKTLNDLICSDKVREDKKSFLEECKEKLEVMAVLVELVGDDKNGE